MDLALEVKKIGIYTNIAPLYRKDLWTVLLNSKKYEFHFYSGIDDSSGIKKMDIANIFRNKKNQFHPLKNIYLKNGVLIWQKKIFRSILFENPQAVILMGDSWILSTWIIGLISRFKGIHVIYWGHGFYGNETGIKKIFRKTFFKIANSHLVYERRGKMLMIENGFSADSIHILFNSINYDLIKSLRLDKNKITKSEYFNFFNNPELPTLIFIGRLTPVKKLDLLLSAINTLNKNEGLINALIVGEGPKLKELQEISEREIAEGRVYFYGACYSEDELSKLLSASDLCVSPGNVGLTAIHSLSYGTPVCTHNNLNRQMPEAGAIQEGFNGTFFIEENTESLIESIKTWLFNNSMNRETIRRNCYQIVDQYYNPNYQSKVIHNLLEKGKPLL